VLRIFQTTGFDELFEIHSPLGAAVDRDGNCKARPWATHGGMSSFRCEVRAYATRSAIARNHENPESEQLIEEHERFAVVEAVSGSAAKLARRSYPRQWRGRETRLETSK
jgi:hypothetical protein